MAVVLLWSKFGILGWNKLNLIFSHCLLLAMNSIEELSLSVLTCYVLSCCYASNIDSWSGFLGKQTWSQHAGSSEGQQGASNPSLLPEACPTTSLQLLTDGGSHIITHFRSISNSLWWISIFTRRFVNSILVLPLGTHEKLPGLPLQTCPVLWNVRSLMKGQGWHCLTHLDSWLDVNPKRAN